MNKKTKTNFLTRRFKTFSRKERTLHKVSALAVNVQNLAIPVGLVLPQHNSYFVNTDPFYVKLIFPAEGETNDDISLKEELEPTLTTFKEESHPTVPYSQIMLK